MDTAFAPLTQAFWDSLASLWWLWAFFGAMIALRLGFAYLEHRRLVRAGISEIDRMDGITFERYLEVLFGKLGYRVQRTQASGDYGADLILEKDGIRTIVQAKRYQKNVGVRAVQEVVAAQKMYRGAKTRVVTNSGYTEQARQLAQANGVELWDRSRLVKHILEVQKREKHRKSAAAVNDHEQTP